MDMKLLYIAEILLIVAIFSQIFRQRREYILLAVAFVAVAVTDVFLQTLSIPFPFALIISIVIVLVCCVIFRADRFFHIKKSLKLKGVRDRAKTVGYTKKIAGECGKSGLAKILPETKICKKCE